MTPTFKMVAMMSLHKKALGTFTSNWIRLKHGLVVQVNK